MLRPDKSAAIRARLARRVVAAGCRDLAAYADLLDSPAGAAEMPDMISALTNKVTQFFREAHHFTFLRETVLRDWHNDGRTPLRIWSAGCSSGQEPYSIAMALSPPIVPPASAPPLSVLGTDIDSAVLARAELGEYGRAETGALGSDIIRNWFEPIPTGLRARRALRSKVEFRRHNLLRAWDFPCRFDVIFCRNVLIYFDADAQALLWERFHRQLGPGGWLLVGHSEQAPDSMRGRLRAAAPTIYQALA